MWLFMLAGLLAFEVILLVAEPTPIKAGATLFVALLFLLTLIDRVIRGER